MSKQPLPVAAILGLGLTQNIGYGTLYYAFSILAPSMAGDFAVSNEWIFGALSIALLTGGLLAPWLGRLIDRLGAARIMTTGSALAACALLICSATTNSFTFIAALTLVEIAANLVQYGAAFALLVQLNPHNAQRSIVYLTLLGGFASTIFWPLTAQLQHWMTWQQIYIFFAALHITICMPVHYLLSRIGKKHHIKAKTASTPHTSVTGNLSAQSRNKGFRLLLIAFSLQALIAAAIIVHMVPLLSALGLAGSAAFIGALFGPAQVASRLINMIAGKELAPVNLAIIAIASITIAIFALMAGAPYISAAIVFTCFLGFGNGLFSIVSGTLPLSLFGNNGYGAMQGKLMSARLILSATAPFAMALGLNNTSVYFTLSVITALGLITILLYLRLKTLAATSS